MTANSSIFVKMPSQEHSFVEVVAVVLGISEGPSFLILGHQRELRARGETIRFERMHLGGSTLGVGLLGRLAGQVMFGGVQIVALVPAYGGHRYQDTSLSFVLYKMSLGHG